MGRITRGIKAIALAAMACGMWANGAAAVVAIDWTTVGNPGNAADPTIGFGAVAYTYVISKQEVTNGQYAEFLNAKAASDPLALYSTSMGSNANGGITRSGVSPSFTYAVKPGQGNQPVVFVSWYDTIRFVNWFQNGQGSGDTETGAYTLLGGTPTPSNGGTITRNGGANYFLTTENEWHKAAFHQPVAAGGDSDSYWLYSTRTNTEPNSDQPPGAISIQGNVANFNRDDSLANGFNDGYAVTGSTSFSSSQSYLTDVGAYTGTSSYYGTFDQGGNVWEWTEALVSSSRAFRGGSWNFQSNSLRADSGRGLPAPTTENFDTGFRVAAIPEPASTMALLALGGLSVLRRRPRGRGRG